MDKWRDNALSEIKVWHLIKAADLEVWCTLTVVNMRYLGHMLHSSVLLNYSSKQKTQINRSDDLMSHV